MATKYIVVKLPDLMKALTETTVMNRPIAHKTLIQLFGVMQQVMPQAHL